MTGRPILTAEKMRSAEQRAIDGGTSVEELMERAKLLCCNRIPLFRFIIPNLKPLSNAKQSRSNICRVLPHGSLLARLVRELTDLPLMIGVSRLSQ